jgi:hypothetical protein
MKKNFSRILYAATTGLLRKKVGACVPGFSDVVSPCHFLAHPGGVRPRVVSEHGVCF